jgi:iron-sulfur cluster assembly accessory protein|tara:strand:+ start:364 stop:744 length:381 start_codon:yes stop_codon:yes gene_type:complete
MSICTLTDTAKQQITTICNENEVYAVTLNLKGGGCAGFEYDWSTYKTADELLDDDTIIYGVDGATFVVGAMSLMYLFGTEIDYVKSIIGSSFEIRNPNAQSACGCGVSVNFNLEKVEENAMITELT